MTTFVRRERVASAIVAIYSVGKEATSGLKSFTEAVARKIPEVVDGVKVDFSSPTGDNVVGVVKEAEQVVVRVPTVMKPTRKQCVRSVLKDCIPVVYTPAVAFQGRLYEIA